MDLQAFISEVKNIAEPECIDKLLLYLDDRRMEDEDFITELLEKVQDLTIYWPHPWYQQCPFSITRPFKMRKGMEPFRTDSFSKAEDEIIDKNWRKLVKKFSIPDKPKCFATWKNRYKDHKSNVPEEKLRQFVTAYLARGLERNLYQVYRHILTFYGAPNKGDYTEQELKVMEICFYHCPSKAVVYLAEILGREPRGIRKRFMALRTGSGVREKKKVFWTLELASTFLHLLIKHTGLPPKKLKYKQISKETWLEIEKEMDHYHAYLMYFWHTYLHVQLFVKCDVKIKRLRRKILKILTLYPYQVWTDIRWKQVQTHLPDGFTPQFIRKTMHTMVIKTFPEYLRAPLHQLISHVRHKLKSLSNRRLRTLELDKNGQLQVVRHQQKFNVEM